MTAVKKTITFVTSNLNKLAEVQAILHDYTVNHISLDLCEIQGDHREIAVAKCVEAYRHVQSDVLVEDTALAFNALGGLPGAYVKESIGCEGLHTMLQGFPDKSARAICIFAYLPAGATPDPKEVELFEGACKGHIVSPRAGEGKPFGWDPIFEPEKSEETFAEMSAEAKNAISHRSRALKALKRHFQRKRPHSSTLLMIFHTPTARSFNNPTCLLKR
ncbi:Ham1 protein domain containing protein [Aphelenchoides fujianensis]|nr:Ham1 protein domain containing protein [Aphelenchoides fujianensis]